VLSFLSVIASAAARANRASTEPVCGSVTTALHVPRVRLLLNVTILFCVPASLDPHMPLLVVLLLLVAVLLLLA
jgi:hypothetical protein